MTTTGKGKPLQNVKIGLLGWAWWVTCKRGGSLGFSLAVRLILGHPLDHCGFGVRPVFFSRQSNSGIPVGYTWYPHEIPWICPLYQSLNLKNMFFQSVFRDWMGLEGSFSASIAGWKKCKTPQKMAGCQQRKLSSLAASVKCGRGATGAFSEESQGLSPGEIAPRTIIPSENLLHTSGKWPIDRWFHVFYPLNWTTWQWTKWPFWKWHVRRASANEYWRIGTWVYGFWNGSAKNGEVLYQQIHVGGWS